MDAANSHALSGPNMVGVFAVITAVFIAVMAAFSGGYTEALPSVMRPTAWLAFALFIVAFTASSMHRLRPGGYSKWAMKNRRYIGLSFAVVHFIHAGLVLSNLWLTDTSRTAGELSGGGLAYLFLLLMAATSNNAAVRAMGVKNWKRLHTVGSYYIWLIFTVRAIRAATDGELSALLIATTGLGALVIRLIARGNAKA